MSVKRDPGSTSDNLSSHSHHYKIGPQCWGNCGVRGKRYVCFGNMRILIFPGCPMVPERGVGASRGQMAIEFPAFGVCAQLRYVWTNVSVDSASDVLIILNIGAVPLTGA